jgi:hypothetical protein
MLARGSLAIVLAAFLAATSPASTYYASPTGGEDGRAQSSPFQIADFWQRAKPGDVLLLLDGRYTGDRSMIRPPQGLQGAPKQPITVQALHDGGAEIDGENRRKTVLLYQNDYFVLEGFNVHSAGGGRDNATAVELSRSHHNVVRRVCAWDAQDANTEIFGTQPVQFSKSTIDAVYQSRDGREIVAKSGHLLATPGGATILYRYENGKLTDRPLWPWPMNQRIIDAVKLAGYAHPVDVTKTVFGLAGGKMPNWETKGKQQQSWPLQ